MVGESISDLVKKLNSPSLQLSTFVLVPHVLAANHTPGPADYGFTCLAMTSAKRANMRIFRIKI